MNYNEYQVEAAKTAIYPKDQALTYVTLGLLSEIGELSGAYARAKSSYHTPDAWDHLIKEIGDVYWYAAMFTHTVLLPFSDTHNRIAHAAAPSNLSRGFTILNITDLGGEIAGHVKKYIRDGDESGLPGFFGSKYEAGALDALSKLLFQLEVLLKQLGTTPEAVMAANVAKLKDRQERGVLSGSGDSR